MLIIEINGDEYRLWADTKRQEKLKHELLSRYPDDAELSITDKGQVIDKMKLSDLFCEK